MNKPIKFYNLKYKLNEIYIKHNLNMSIYKIISRPYLGLAFIYRTNQTSPFPYPSASISTSSR